MNTPFNIDKSLKTPVYKQIEESIVSSIEHGSLKEGDQLPSINQIAKDESLARETVVKAFKELQEKGLVSPIHGKGFFVTSKQTNTQHRVFVLFDTFSAYKEVMYNSIKETFGKDVILDIYFHHYNARVFNTLLSDAIGNYTAYIILPFDNVKILKPLQTVPQEKVYIIDQNQDFLKNQFSGIYQDFKQDIYSALEELRGSLLKYSKLNLIYKSGATQIPKELKVGFESFCKSHAIDYEIDESKAKCRPKKGEAFLSLDDIALVTLVEHAIASNWAVGEDIGILSYNDTPLKKVVAGGISVISTDFKAMGQSVANMIIHSKHKITPNPFQVIDRGSL